SGQYTVGFALTVGRQQVSRARPKARQVTRAQTMARSLHAAIKNDLSVTTDERSSFPVSKVIRRRFWRCPCVPMSINRQVRLGDFLFTGE
ncbi:hypothetical protein, partial [Pseudomonas marginalis]|uniref:hypothetical protein n=1 Tax=Pseudomonas marginalis TaxID=298 RepID=UPI001C80EB3B